VLEEIEELLSVFDSVPLIALLAVLDEPPMRLDTCAPDFRPPAIPAIGLEAVVEVEEAPPEVTIEDVISLSSAGAFEFIDADTVTASLPSLPVLSFDLCGVEAEGDSTSDEVTSRTNS
jgi:hypothetical protein